MAGVAYWLLAPAIGLAFINVWLSQAIYVSVALMWFIPDRRIERVVHTRHQTPSLSIDAPSCAMLQ